MSNGIDESKIEELMESFEKAKAVEDKRKLKEKEKVWKVLTKYFVHGIGFSVLFLILTIAWVFVYFILISIGLFLGFIIGLVLLMLAIGFLNSVFMTQLWNVSIQTGFWNMLFHGIALLIILVIVGVPFVIVSMVAPSTVTEAVTFIIGSFVRGFTAKKVGGLWKQQYREGIPEAVETEWKNKNL